MAKARKSVAKSGAVAKNVEVALQRLADAVKAGDAALATRSKNQKKLAAEVKRFAKRKGVLVRKRKAARVRAKKAPGADTRRALRQIEKDLGSTNKVLTKARADKGINGAELAALKTSVKQASAYAKAIAAADRSLNKGKKRAG